MSIVVGGIILLVIAAKIPESIPDDAASEVIVMPTAPNPPDAILAIKASPAALTGLMPIPTIKAVVIATGPPKPIAPSKNEPKQYVINTT